MRPAPELVLATDLDGTFLGGSGAARRALYRWIEQNRESVHLIFVTGRDLPHIRELCAAPGFPTPDHIVGDVGTTVVDGRSHEPVAAIQDDIAARWADSGDAVRAWLADTPGLRPQAGPFARRASFFYDPATLDPAVAGRVREAGFDCLLSAETFFDVLPRGVNKGSTLLALLAELELPAERTLVAGDTMNDWSLFETRLPGVVVGNAEPKLLERTHDLPWLHHSRAHGAAGILDALAVRLEGSPLRPQENAA